MNIALPSALLLLILGGCANQQPADDPVLNQRFSSLDVNNQSAQNLIGELGRKVESLSGELRRIQETVAAQAAQINRDQAARTGAAAALAKHIEESDKRLNDLAAQTRDVASQATSLKTAMQEKSGEIRQRVDRLAAQLQLDDANHALALQAELADLAERIEASEKQLDELLGQAGETATLAGDQKTALNEKSEAANKRIEQLAGQLNTLHGQDEAARQAGTAALTARLAALDKRLEEIARMAQDALDATGLGQRKIFGKVIESITLTEDKTLFPINSPTLGEQDTAKLDALVNRLKALGTNYHLQIQGHTDGIGADDNNYELGKARAEAVKNYLNEKGGIPLLRMSVMSYGSLEATGYATKSNRRIVVQVMQ